MKNTMTKTERRKAVTRDLAQFLNLLGTELVDDGEGGRMSFRYPIAFNIETPSTKKILFEYQRSQMDVCHGEPKNSKLYEVASNIEKTLNVMLKEWREKYSI